MVYQKIVVGGIVWQILIKSSYFGTITERIKNVFQKIAISGIVCQILIKSSYLGSIAGKRKISSRKLLSVEMYDNFNQIKYLGIINEKRKRTCMWKCMAKFQEIIVEN